jgi:hypothetical protein
MLASSTTSVTGDITVTRPVEIPVPTSAGAAVAGTVEGTKPATADIAVAGPIEVSVPRAPASVAPGAITTSVSPGAITTSGGVKSPASPAPTMRTDVPYSAEAKRYCHQHEATEPTHGDSSIVGGFEDVVCPQGYPINFWT